MSNVAPEYLRDLDETWHDMPDGVPGWSENYLSGMCFPAAEAGCWLHHSRPHHDARFWEEVFTFALPGDRFLMSKGATLAVPGGNGAVGPGLTYDCVEPYERWRKAFHGLARLVSGDELRAGPLADGPLVAVDMELDWVSAGPPFDMDMSEQVWADVKAHYQQHGRITGTIEFPDERLELEGVGMRDHSWGPRDLRGLGNHTWIYAEFPSGRRVMYFHHVAAGGGGLLDVGHEMDGVALRADAQRAARVTGDATTPIRVAGDLPVPRDPDRWAEPYAIDFRRGDGSVSTLRGEILSGIPLAMTNRSELQLGRPGPDATHHLFECPSRIEWDGETGYGITEWTWRTDQ